MLSLEGLYFYDDTLLERARRLLGERDPLMFNLAKCCYVSNRTSIEQVLAELGDRASTPNGDSHVDRSMDGPGAYGSTRSPDFVYNASNLTGTFQLLQAVSSHWEQLPSDLKAAFRIHHIRTDEVFGSLSVSSDIEN